ncbi:hypothetical protein L7F22_028633 [Adiantum nelumboides]|nr:hypothetical protein [Adiantum nelumboides]
MTKRPRWWWIVIACIPYLITLNETWMYAKTAYSLHSFLEDYKFSTYPFLVLLTSSALTLALCATIVGHIFFRFHVVTRILLEILVQVFGRVVPQSLYWGKFGAHYWLALSFAFFFIVMECIWCALNGMYADVPFLSDASYMQIPYDT